MGSGKKIESIREEYRAAGDTSLPFFIETYACDARQGVQKLVEQGTPGRTRGGRRGHPAKGL